MADSEYLCLLSEQRSTIFHSFFPPPQNCRRKKKKMIWKRFVNAIALLFVLGSGLLTFLLILNGALDDSSSTLKKFYWLEADTTGFRRAAPVTRWYNYGWCGYADGHLYNCSSKMAAQPFSPIDNFGFSQEMPRAFIVNKKTYYYLSRVAWAMLLVGLFFIFVTIVPMIVNIFRAFSVTSLLSTINCWLAAFFVTLSACLYTGCYVKARNVFHNDDRSASLGVKNMAFIWTSVFLLLLTAIWNSVLTALRAREKLISYNSREDSKAVSVPYDDVENTSNHQQPPTKTTTTVTQTTRHRRFFNKLNRKKTADSSNASSSTTTDGTTLPEHYEKGNIGSV